MKKITLLIFILIFAGLFYFSFIAKPEKPPKVEDRYSKTLVLSKVFEALGKIADPQAKQILIKGLKSKDFFIRAYAVQSLGRLKDKGAISPLESLVNDENYLVRIYAIKALVKLGQLDKEKTLLSLLSDKDPAVRANVVEQLGDFGDKYSALLVKLLSEDSNYFVQIKAIEQLAKNKFVPAVDLIYKALEDKDAQVRQAACSAISVFNDKKYIPLLIQRLGDGDIGVRATAKESLSILGESSLIKMFWQDIEDKDPILRGSSFVALANLKDINILPVLLKEITLPGNSLLVRDKAATALTILKPCISELIGKALSTPEISNILLLENLELSYKVNGRNLILLLIEALKDKKNPLYQDAPFILRELQDEMSLPALRQALFYDDPDMVANAAYALGELHDKEALNYLIMVCKKYGF